MFTAYDYFPPSPPIISNIYGVVVTSHNGGDNAQHIATKGSRIQEWLWILRDAYQSIGGQYVIDLSS